MNCSPPEVSKCLKKIISPIVYTKVPDTKKRRYSRCIKCTKMYAYKEHSIL